MDSTPVKVCLVIPIFNHSEEFVPVAQKLEALAYPTLLVDDGSDAANAEILDKLAQQYAWLQLHRLEKNGGKGVAVCEGLQKAEALGYTHALQIDADGQHNINDIDKFIDTAKQNPAAIVTGNRIYINAPKSRQYARKLTDIWVCINTLSLAASDSMCGFRLYPLAATQSYLRKHNVGRRMDFDSDILVKLIWKGVPIVEIKTEVVYRPEISSHFDVWRDNVAISLMHTRLFFGMLPRIPMLLARKFLRTRRTNKHPDDPQAKKGGL